MLEDSIVGLSEETDPAGEEFRKSMGMQACALTSDASGLLKQFCKYVLN